MSVAHRVTIDIILNLVSGAPRSSAVTDVELAEIQIDARACATKESPIEDGILNAVVAPSTTTPVVELPLAPVNGQSSPSTAIPVVEPPPALSPDAPSTEVNGTHPPGILPALQELESARVKWRSGRDSNPRPPA